MEPPAWIDALERRLGGWSVPHMLRGLVILNALTFLLDLSSRGFAEQLLLTQAGLAQDQYWRLVTFLFAREASTGVISLVFFFFWMSFTWMIGDVLEREWGSFKLTIYILLPVVLLGAVVVAGLAPAVPNHYVYYSLFFAFATLHPDYEIMLFPLPVPLKVKWIAWIGLGFTLLALAFNPRGASVLVASYSSYLLFFTVGWMEWYRMRREVRAKRARFRGDDE
jgi:membrane associated rhomboid family serine protease